MHKLLQKIMLLGCLLFGGIQLQAQATLSVQGTILQGGTLAAIDNGQYDITFKLYTTDAGGTPIWTEVQSVPIVGGVYSVLLGDVNPLNVPFDQPYYLGLTIPGGPEHTPRARLTSSPYALSLLGQDNKFPSTGNVGIGTTTPGTTLAVDGSIATGQATTTATAYTVAADDHVIFLDHTANQNVTLPAASTANAGRHLMLVNKEAVAKTLTSSNYVDILAATSTTVPANSVIELQSNGSVWRQTGGYVTPSAGAEKAYVLAGPTGSQSYPHVTFTTIAFTEAQDAQNCFASNTFTAPRTGFYRVNGSLFGGGGSWPGNGYMIVRCGGTCAFGTSQYNLSIEAVRAGSLNMSVQFNSDVYMTAGQTLFFQLAQQSGASASLNPPPDAWLTILEQ